MQAKSILLCGALLPLAVAAAPAASGAGHAAKPTAARPSAVADTPITGTVLDEKGVGLPGVTIVLMGTTIGATTDANGSFMLRIPTGTAGATLVISSVGYNRQEVAVGQQTSVTVNLTVAAQALDEAVVIGYGSQV